MWLESDCFKDWDTRTSLQSLHGETGEWPIALGHVKLGTTNLAAIQSAFSTRFTDFSRTLQSSATEKALNDNIKYAGTHLYCSYE